MNFTHGFTRGEEKYSVYKRKNESFIIIIMFFSEPFGEREKHRVQMSVFIEGKQKGFLSNVRAVSFPKGQNS